MRLLEQAFWMRVDKQGPDACWLWLAKRDRNGYAKYLIGQKGVAASRIAWEIANDRDWPEGAIACHRCDNPPCVNPAHIWPGTHAENIRDCIAKGRAGGVTAFQDNGHNGICRKCGHHRTDDYRETYPGGATVWKCRACNKRRASNRRARILQNSQVSA